MSAEKGREEIPGWLGNVPFPPDKKKPCLLTDEDARVIFYGSGKEKICATIYCSTDSILFSEWEVPPGQSFQPSDIHSGDETYYVLSGELTEVDHTTGQALQIRKGECIYIPRKTWHSAYNFTDKKLDIIAPAEGGMWADDDLDQVSDLPAVGRLQLAPQAADHAGGQRAVEPERVADRKHLLPDLEVV